jgi:hypothetical protein
MTMMMSLRKTKKRMRSTNIFLRCVALAGVCAALMAAGDKKKSSEPDTVIAGTVFRDPGYALPEATVTLVRREDPKHKKLADLTTNFRGEFVIHVPATPEIYVVKASAKGFRAEEKEASVTGLDRVDLMFTLEPEKKK